MHKSIVRTVLEPIFTRLGSMLAGALVGVGLAAEQGPTVQSLFVALGLLGVDLVSRKVVKAK